ncbi:MAG: SGNH/GDSL hydrolase family protein, partial [Candidatus Omnitrophica bacterium]|nr:SGNH/GDSL hydrolase family protein [Candidatus Omnitrophota bacterium]
VKPFQTWPKQLERILEEKGIRSETINTGVNGYSTRIYYKVLKKFYHLYHPDIVIVLVFSNDPGGDIADAKKRYSIVTSNDGWLKKFLKRHSHLAKNLWFVYQTYFPRKYDNFHAIDIAKRDETDAEFNLAYKLYKESLVNMKQFCQENNIFFALTTIPSDIPSFIKFTEKVCKNKGINYISQKSLLGEEGIVGINSAGHYSPKGYNLLANSIAEYISEKENIEKHFSPSFFKDPIY